MNRKGFTLIEMLGCLALLGLVLGIGLYVTRDTLSTSLSTLTSVSDNQIKEAATLYVSEIRMTWINESNEEYTCLTIKELVDAGYFDLEDVMDYKDDYVRISRTPKTKVIEKIQILDECE